MGRLKPLYEVHAGIYPSNIAGPSDSDGSASPTGITVTPPVRLPSAVSADLHSHCFLSTLPCFFICLPFPSPPIAKHHAPGGQLSAHASAQIAVALIKAVLDGIFETIAALLTDYERHISYSSYRYHRSRTHNRPQRHSWCLGEGPPRAGSVASRTLGPATSLSRLARLVPRRWSVCGWARVRSVTPLGEQRSRHPCAVSGPR